MVTSAAIKQMVHNVRLTLKPLFIIDCRVINKSLCHFIILYKLSLVIVVVVIVQQKLESKVFHTVCNESVK